MVRLLIIADDFTGALDTGVQFSDAGIRTKVIVSQKCPEMRDEPDDTVLIIDAETRHLSRQQAYNIVYNLCRKALQGGVSHIYKKTDSALRGNVGSELEAVYDAMERSYLAFMPAWPAMNRTVDRGILYIHGQPVAESVFGSDPFEPVIHNSVSEILKEQTNKLVVEMKSVSDNSQEQGIWVFDSVTQEEMNRHVIELNTRGLLNVMAGCAGFAALLPEALSLQGDVLFSPELDKSLLVVSGSINPITKNQLEYANCHGIPRITMTIKQKLDRSYWKSEAGSRQLDEWWTMIKSSKHCMIDANGDNGVEETGLYAAEKGMSTEEVRCCIADVMGYVLKELLERGISHTLMVTGGDTLLGFMENLSNSELHILSKLEQGCVLSQIKYKHECYHIISKSGGFGSEDLLCRLIEKVEGGK